MQSDLHFFFELILYFIKNYFLFHVSFSLFLLGVELEMKKVIFKLRKNIYHRLTASSRYQLHSPFLYKLATEIFSGKTNYKSANYHQLLKIKSSERNIISYKNAQVLSRLLVLSEPKNILYIGYSKVNTNIITQASSNSNVISIEVGTDFVNLNAILRDDINTLDFVFYDRDTDVEKIKIVFDKCLNYKNNNSVFVFDDIYHTNAMNEIWNYVKNHLETIVSIDLFHMGIVLFRKEMSRQQIKYRY